MRDLVSVVITTRNSIQTIESCLQSIKKQSYPQNKIEIIVVDNNSDDKSIKIASLYTAKVYNHGPERSAQRNFGAKKAAGEYLLYLDADMWLSNNVIAECVNKFDKKDKLLALYIPEIIIGDSWLSYILRFERQFYNATAIDAVRFIKKNIFDKVGGFDEALTGPEDWDLDKKIRSKGAVNIISSPLYHDQTSLSLSNFLDKKGYYSKSFDSYIKKWGNEDFDIRRQFGFYYRFLGVFIEKGKWKKLIKNPLLAASMVVLRFLVGLQLLRQRLFH